MEKRVQVMEDQCAGHADAGRIIGRLCSRLVGVQQHLLALCEQVGHVRLAFASLVHIELAAAAAVVQRFTPLDDHSVHLTVV